MIRALFALSGLALLTYGALLVWDFATSRTVNAVQGAAWFVGGPLIHDGLVAPAVGLTGVVLTRVLPKPWRAPVTAGVVLSGVLTLVAIPLLWRPYGTAVNPGLHDRDYGAGLAVALGAVWAAVLVTGLVRRRRSARRPRAGQS
ncbi:hypothetical protein [Actinophytocola sp.]|uniref:hypothetical protein n=1 Tax=Actinophytocola sp. TaxID=1872138 RepID=UPI00389AAFE6